LSQQSPRAVVVYCASSDACDPCYRVAARRLGELLALERCTVVYGGGRAGSMGALADGALAAGGLVVGVLPQFLKDLELAHGGLSELHVVSDMRSRKQMMLSKSEAVVALPGGCGTFEELLEAVTLKRLGIYSGPILIVNTRGYYDPLIAMFAAAIERGFMSPEHAALWQVVASPEDALLALRSSWAMVGGE